MQGMPVFPDLPPVAVSSSPSAIRAVLQFVALMTSSHARCGACSPARHACCLSPLARHIWRKWVVGTSAVISLVVERRRDPIYEMSLVSQAVPFSVSRATLGITRDLNTGWNSDQWVAPDVAAERGSGGGSRRLASLRLKRERRETTGDGDGRSYGGGGAEIGEGGGAREHGGDRALLICREGVLCEAVNTKWWVTCEVGRGGTGSGKKVTLAVTCIQGYTSYQVPAASVDTLAGIDVPWDIPEECPTSLFLDNVVSDEALFAFCCHATKMISLTLFDVRKTYESRRIAVLVQTSTGTNQVQSASLGFGPFKVPVALVLRRKKTDGHVVFIVKPADGNVFQVESTTGVAKLLSTRCSDLSQLNDYMFCMAYGNEKSFELWDCHSTDKPVRCIQPSSDNFDQVIAGCGFLFAVTKRDRKIQVIDASSGLAVIALEVLFTSEFFINQQYSFFS